MKKTLLIYLATIVTLTVTANTVSAQAIGAQTRGNWGAGVVILDKDNDSDGWGKGLRFGGEYSGERICSNRTNNGWGGPKRGLTFWAGGNVRMVIDSTGHVGIGTEPSGSLQAMLTVNGNVSIEGQVKVKSITMSSNPRCWPDYVFAKNYKLMNLGDLENFINTNHHLPNFPSVKDIETNHGSYDVNEITTGLLKTIEEQALYIIKLNKEFNSRLDEQNTKISELQEKLSYATN